MTQNTEMVLGYTITTKACADCIADIIGWMDGAKGASYLACVNPHSLEVARKDPQFERALRSADLLVPDGVGIILASIVNNGVIRGRVTGSDIFHGVSASLNRRGNASVFFLGSTPAILQRIRTRMAKDYPAVRVAGVYSPPFREEFSEAEIEDMLTAVNRARPDVLWVGMTAPKQEKWIHRNRARLNVRVIAAVGAVFDFYSRSVERSSPIFQRMGLEWMPRFIREPGRLWRRNLISNPAFLFHVMRERAGRQREEINSR